jgi:type IV secretory pathway VirB10-like protein
VSDLLYILAQQEESPGWLRALPAIIFFALWALSALASWWGKRQQEMKRREAREQIERSARQPQASAPVPAPVAPTPRRPQAQRPKRQPAKPAPPPLPKAPQRPAVVEASATRMAEEGLVFETEIGSGYELPRARGDRRPSNMLLAGGVNTRTVRSNYLIHEILKPPVSMRDPDDR